ALVLALAHFDPLARVAADVLVPAEEHELRVAVVQVSDLEDAAAWIARAAANRRSTETQIPGTDLVTLRCLAGPGWLRAGLGWRRGLHGRGRGRGRRV